MTRQGLIKRLAAEQEDTELDTPDHLVSWEDRPDWNNMRDEDLEEANRTVLGEDVHIPESEERPLRDRPAPRRFRANPTGTATETQRIEFLAGLVGLAQTMLAQGGAKSRSPLRQLLRSAIYCFWEERDFKRYHARRPRSRAAMGLPDNKLTYDHAIPISLVADELLAGPATPEAVRRTLEELVHGCLITFAENEALTAAKLRDKLPPGANPRDRMARYDAVGIVLAMPPAER